MVAVTLERVNLSASDLRQAACRVDDPTQARRLLAIAMVLDGWSRTDAARAAGMDRQTLRDRVHRYNAEGVDGLRDRPRSGRPSQLKPEHFAKLEQWVEAGPDVAADGLVRWRCVDLRDRLAERFAVTLSERSVARLLNKRGFRRLSARPRHPKADEAAQDAFKKTSPKP